MYTLMTKNRRIIAWEASHTLVEEKRAAAMQVDNFMERSKHEVSHSQWMELRRFKDLNYIDYVMWLRHPAPFADTCRKLFGLKPTAFAGVCRQALDSLEKRNVINNDAMNRFWSEHSEQKCDNSQIIITLVTLELICQLFAE
jgi:hypothetical protein